MENQYQLSSFLYFTHWYSSIQISSRSAKERQAPAEIRYAKGALWHFLVQFGLFWRSLDFLALFGLSGALWSFMALFGLCGDL